MSLRLHATLAASRANGPGKRFVIWFRGCSLGCPGCFNPDSHDSAGGELVTVSELLTKIEAANVQGVTISGGEPLQQPQALLELCQQLRKGPHSILLFSGYTRAEIEGMPLGRQILTVVDVLIDGRFQAREKVATGLRGSSNQAVHLLTDRYTFDEIAATPELEIQIDASGAVVVSGVQPVPLGRRDKLPS